jgi:ATP-dependent DNA helicase 2 subunit 2
MPFAEDIRDIAFPSITHLFNRRNERVTEHKFLPTQEQNEAMDAFVDSMDLTNLAAKDEEEAEYAFPTCW